MKSIPQAKSTQAGLSSNDICLSWEDNCVDRRVERMSMYEASFVLSAEFANPYDPEHAELDATFLLPDGTRQSVPLFWHQDYKRLLVRGEEILQKMGAPGWRLRFTPRQVGNYSYEVAVKVHSGQSGSAISRFGPYSFTATPTHDPGFLRVSPRDPAYLEFENGALFLGIGHNLCGWEWGGTDNRRGTYDYDEWLLALAQHGANMSQFDFCEGDQLEWTHHDTELPFSRDWGGLVRYNQQTAWKMDQRLQRAEELGIYVRLTLLHWEDFDHEAEHFPDWGWHRNPYNIANGGPVSTAGAFFSDAEARKIFKKQLRYIVARWGYSKSILAYELWNEVDAPWLIWGEGKSYSSHEIAITDWHRDLSSYIRSIDPNNHLITTSYERSDHGDAVWALDNIDLSTFHRYTYFNPDYGEIRYDTVATLQKLISGRLLDTAKPVLAGEFALSPGGDVQKEQDPAGVALHQQLWSSVMLKSLGTAMHWTWGSYMHALGLYKHYRPLSRFFADEELRGLETFSNIGAAEATIVYLGLYSPNRVLLWVRDPRFDFNSLEGTTSNTPLAGERVHLNGLHAGEYLVEIYDCWTGESMGRSTATVESGFLQLELPDFCRDIAVKVSRREYDANWHSIDIGCEKKISATDLWGRHIELYAGGSGVGEQSDQLRYAYAPVAGDFTLEACIDELTNLGEFVRAGLMSRVSEAPDANFVYLAVSPTGKATWLHRDGSLKRLEASTPHDAGLFWSYKLQRHGDLFSAFISRDGVEWRLIGETRALGWPNTLFVGVAAASKDDYTYVKSHFSNVRLTRRSDPSAGIEL